MLCSLPGKQGCGVRVARSRSFLHGVGIVFLRWVGVGLFFPTPTPEVQLNHFIHCASVPVEMVRFLLKFLLKLRILAVYHDFHWLLVATKLLTAKLHSCYAKESKSGVGGGVGIGNFGKVGVGVGLEHFSSESSTLLESACLVWQCIVTGQEIQVTSLLWRFIQVMERGTKRLKYELANQRQYGVGVSFFVPCHRTEL